MINGDKEDTNSHCSLCTELGSAASWERYMNLWHRSSPCTLSLHFEEANHSVDQEILPLQNHFLVHKLNMGAQEEGALIILSAFWELGHEDVRVTHVRRSSLV